jgi:hypothetical protein
MPEWIHQRADHIRAKNPGMSESQSFAIATQQAHASGKAPRGFGTPEGKREAKKKYDEPKSAYKKTADPGHIAKTSSVMVMWAGFSDELQKIAFAGASTVSNVTKPIPTPGMKLPKLTAKPVVTEPESPASKLDLLGSSRTPQPPPVTSGG